MRFAGFDPYVGGGIYNLPRLVSACQNLELCEKFAIKNLAAWIS